MLGSTIIYCYYIYYYIRYYYTTHTPIEYSYILLYRLMWSYITLRICVYNSYTYIVLYSVIYRYTPVFIHLYTRGLNSLCLSRIYIYIYISKKKNKQRENK